MRTLQTQLHFEHISKIQPNAAVRLQTQHARIDLIQNYLAQGKKLKPPEATNDVYTRSKKGSGKREYAPSWQRILQARRVA
ncbi:MAG: hypothetical protein JJT82_08735 [Legionellaceae bacterium]|nr:hypothetical protein [Legionellaceae bacterium]